MQNIDIRFNATSNFGAVEAQMDALQARATALQRTFATQGYAKPPVYADPAAWRDASTAIDRASREYRNAASSSGLLNAQQIRANSEVKRYTELLRKQKLGVRDMTRNWNIMREAYRDQLRMQRMTAQHWGTDPSGKQVIDITVPKNVPGDLDNIRSKVGFIGDSLRSAGNSMINFGKNTQWAGRQLMVGFTYPVTIFAGLAGTMAYQVDKQMTRIEKVYDAAATNMIDKEQELLSLRTQSMDLARRAAEEYGVAATETLGVEAELAAAGLTGSRLVGGTQEVVRIGTLGELDFDKATQMAITLQTAFRDTIKDTNDLSNAFNYLNALENSTSLSLQDMTDAIPRAAAGFAQLGGTVEEMGVLMTALKESGIDPATGANALKSASTRIINPVTDAVEYYKKYEINLNALAKQSGGNLFDYLRLLGKEQQKIQGPTEKQTALMRAQGVAALFGTYQNNRLTAALTNVGDAYAGVQNQTARALDVAKMTNQELEAMAAGELARKMNSASGRFTAALESIKIELADMGTPFLEAGTAILGVLEKIITGFNNLPDGVKHFMMIGAMLTAVAGPLIMLTGLFFNLFGQFTKGIGTIMTFVTRWRTFTEQEKAADVITRQMNATLAQQSSATNTLQMELAALSAAYEKATIAATAHFDALSPAALAAQGQKNAIRAEMGALGVGTVAGPVAPTTIAGVTRTTNRLGQDQYRTAGGTFANAAQVEAYKRASAEALAVNQRVYAMQEKIRGSSEATTAAGIKAGQAARESVDDNDKNAKALNRGAKAAGLMQVALMGSMVTGGKLQGILMGTTTALFAVSAAQQIGLTNAIAGSWKNAGSLVGRYKTAGSKALTIMTTQAKTFGRALLGPWGLALAAVAGGAYLVWQKMQEPAEQQEAINNSVETWADALGVVQKKYAEIDTSINQYSDNSVTTQELADRLVSTDDGKKMVDAMSGFMESGNTAEAGMLAAQEYIKLLTQTNATAEDAQRAIEAMYLASGTGFIEAGEKALELRQTIGSVVDLGDLDTLWEQQITQALNAASNSVDERATGIADMLISDLQRATSEGQRDRLLLNFQTTFDDMNAETWKREIGDSLNGVLDPFGDAANPADIIGMYDRIKAAGIEAGDGTMQAGEDAMKNATAQVAKFYNVSEQEVINLRTAWGELDEGEVGRLEDIAAAQKLVVDRIKERLGITADVATIEELRATAEWQVYTTTLKNIKARVAALREEARLNRERMAGGMFGDTQAALSDATALYNINLRLARVGLPQISSLQEDINWKALEHRERQEEITKETDKTKDKLKEALKVWNEFRKGGWAEAQQANISAAMGAVSSAMMDDLGDTQDAAMDRLSNAQEAASERLANAQAAASDRLSDAHDAASNALDRRLDAASNALDARADKTAAHFDNLSEKVQESYDRRIEGINNVIESEEKADAIRQRLFDREIERISRLAEAQNNNVDFNMAISQGEFDEAARIQNNALAAQATNAYEDAAAKSEQRLERRRAALEDRIEKLEKQRDRRLKEIDKAREQAEKAIEIEREKQERIGEIQRNALEKRQEAEQEALERRQKAEQEALDQRQEDAREHLERRQEMERDSLERQLEIVMSFIPKNEEQAKKYLDRMAKRYDAFGKAWAEGSIKYSDLIDKTMVQQLQKTALELKSDINWAGAGFDAAQGMINGMASAMGMSKGEFTKWLHVQSNNNRPGGNGNDRNRDNNDGLHNYSTVKAAQSNHEGGLIGRGGSGRTGFTGGQSPHRERSVNAKIGEYMVRDKAVAKYGVDFMDRVNEGKYQPEYGTGGPTGAMARFLTGFSGTMMANSVMGTLGSKMQEKVDKMAARQARRQARRGAFDAGQAGMYSDRFFNAKQLKNAATIASVGRKMGMSKRDIQIGIMTAITESGLVNVNYGDRDSLGLFQQRPSMGWGTAAQVTDPQYASHKFFSTLRGVGARDNMAPWLAAQAVQRSAYSDGSNYRQYWDNARAIFRGLSRSGNAGAAAGFVQGGGGRHRPVRGGTVTQGIHYNNAIDIGVPVGSPIYAVSDGTVTGSYDIPGYEPRAPHGGLGYRSYGRVITVNHGGFDTLYAHLSRRSVNKGQRVRGGARMGASGNTGNSTGPHLHFEAHGASPYAFLRQGGTIRYDNTPAILHRDEKVLTAPLSRDLEQGIGNLNEAPFHVTIDLRGATIREDVDIEKAVYTAIDAREKRKGRKRVVN